MADSWSIPTGVPSGSRSIRPCGGSGVSRVTPATSSAREFTQAPCPSRFVSSTGRSGTTASSASRRAIPPGNVSIDQPSPTIHSRSGWAAA